MALRNHLQLTDRFFPENHETLFQNGQAPRDASYNLTSVTPAHSAADAQKHYQYRFLPAHLTLTSITPFIGMFSSQR